jgi:hypothetical protein
MRTIFGFILFLSFLELHAGEIRVKKMVKDGELDRSFVLKTNLADKVVLDCQSFIQGLRIGEFEEAHVFLMEPDECAGLQQRVKGSLRKFQNHCIDVEADIRADYSCQ